jgi:hypothetical protein
VGGIERAWEEWEEVEWTPGLHSAESIERRREVFLQF